LRLTAEIQLYDSPENGRGVVRTFTCIFQNHRDGNGRIGRVINSYLLIREGFVPMNIKFIDRKLYYNAFNEFDKNGKTSIMEEIVGKALTNSYHKRLAYLEQKEIISLADYAKRSGVSHSNLLNKAKRQTIEAFLEKGKWKIGIPVG